jgi:hypothetical protein
MKPDIPPATCAWCGDMLTYNPFTRTHNKRLYLFCTVSCLNDHYTASARLERSQTVLAFGMVR